MRKFTCCNNPDCNYFDISLGTVDWNDWNECCERAQAAHERKLAKHDEEPAQAQTRATAEATA